MFLLGTATSLHALAGICWMRPKPQHSAFEPTGSKSAAGMPVNSRTFLGWRGKHASWRFSSSLCLSCSNYVMAALRTGLQKQRRKRSLDEEADSLLKHASTRLNKDVLCAHKAKQGVHQPIGVSTPDTWMVSTKPNKDVASFAPSVKIFEVQQIQLTMETTWLTHHSQTATCETSDRQSYGRLAGLQAS
eukprot:1156908-Pelagomonas_calceolata.AAC.2